VLIIRDMTPTPLNQDIIYNSLDTMQTKALKDIFDEMMPAWAKYTANYSEKMLGPILTMMRRGVQINTEARDKFVAKLAARKAGVVATFDEICLEVFGTDINWNSPNQLKILFYDFLGIPEQTKSKKGDVKVGTDREILERIIGSYPRGALFALFILRIRDLEKQIEFLSKGLTADNRFTCSYNISGTETFRLSSSAHPLYVGSNLQNIPKAAREIFVADPGYTFFQADQQGAEARLVAYKSGDENYIAAVEGGDSHTMVAAMVFGFDPIRELAEREYFRGYTYRDITKKAAHGTNYYCKPGTVAKNAKIEVDVAEEFQKAYFKRFPGIGDWHLAIARQLQEAGHMTTSMGIRRTFWGRRWDDATLREAIAFEPQSIVGVLTNIGLYNLWLKYEGQPGAPLQILINGHDAVIGQIRTDMLDEILPEMMGILRWPFPVVDIKGVVREVVIPFDVEVGQNWGKYSDENPGGLKKWKGSK
jgi:DNA polymerase I-like protein with 3'-5' exonuclease and polymerase domains